MYTQKLNLLITPIHMAIATLQKNLLLFFSFPHYPTTLSSALFYGMLA